MKLTGEARSLWEAPRSRFRRRRSRVQLAGECPAVFVDPETGDFLFRGKTVTDPALITLSPCSHEKASKSGCGLGRLKNPKAEASSSLTPYCP